MANDDTLREFPAPNRPEYGLLAWQATIGYISQEYSPDAMLTIRVTANAQAALVWSAAATWGNISEAVADLSDLGAALAALWREVDRQHNIFKSLEAAAKRPVNYTEWLDAETQRILNRIIHAAQAAFGTDWRLVIVYQPVANASGRVQMRLIAKCESVNTGARGGSLAEAGHALYRNAASDFASALK